MNNSTTPMLFLVVALSACMPMQVTTSTGGPANSVARFPRRAIPVTFTDRNQFPHGLAHLEGDSLVIQSNDRTPRIETVGEAAQIAFVYSLAAGGWCWISRGLLCPAAGESDYFQVHIAFPGLIGLPLFR